jgi:hypothetical protein
LTVLREYEDSCNTHRPHRTLNQAAPLRPLPDGVTDLDHFHMGMSPPRGLLSAARATLRPFATLAAIIAGSVLAGRLGVFGALARFRSAARRRAL